MTAPIPIGACVLGAALVWQGWESFGVRPHYLAYFNQLAGGPSQGYRRLVDSSLDWGQDLPGLKRWLDEHGLQMPGHAPVYLSYFGTSNPAHYGIDAILLESYFERRPVKDAIPLRAGWYCVSATMLQGVYLAVHGHWTEEHEGTYRTLSTLVTAFQSAGTPEARARLDAISGATGPDFWERALSLYDELRTARLMAWLRHREPDADAGYSILIYRLSDTDVQEALHGAMPE